MQNLGPINALVYFLITICLAYLVLVAIDSPIIQRLPGTGLYDGDYSLFDSSPTTKALSTVNFEDLLLKYSYIFVKWFRLVVSYVSMPFALPLRLVNREWF